MSKRDRGSDLEVHMDQLRLDLDGTIVDLEIKSNNRDEWCLCTFRVHSDFVSYELVDDESLDFSDIKYMIKMFNKLLEGEITGIEEMSFTEPFIEFTLYPKTERIDISADWKFILWTENQVFTNNYISLDMDRDDIVALTEYLVKLDFVR